MQVATEWLFSVPEQVLEKHLGSDPNTPTAEGDSTDDSRRSFAPRRSTLNVSCLEGKILSCMHGSQHQLQALNTKRC